MCELVFFFSQHPWTYIRLHTFLGIYVEQVIRSQSAGSKGKIFFFPQIFFKNKLVISRKTKIVYTPVVWLIWIWLKSAKLSSKRIVPTYQEAYKAPGSHLQVLHASHTFTPVVELSLFSSPNTSTAPSLFLPEEKELAKMDMPNHALRTFRGCEHLLGTFHSVIEDFSVWYPVLLPPHSHPLTQQDVCSFTTLTPSLFPLVSVRCPW